MHAPSADYAKLPTVSFVIPNLDNDMHDGTVAAGDAWLQTNLDGYANWAAAHNSLLVVTFDECAGHDPVLSTPIATILAGSAVRQGATAQWVTLYSRKRVANPTCCRGVG
jgi:phosphatidylinositol-3-phosphatase